MNLAATQEACCLRPSATGAGWSLRRHTPGGLRTLQTLQRSILNRGGSSKQSISDLRVRAKAVDGAQEPSEKSKGGRRLTHLSELADVFPNAAAEAAGPEDESIEVSYIYLLLNAPSVTKEINIPKGLVLLLLAQMVDLSQDMVGNDCHYRISPTLCQQIPCQFYEDKHLRSLDLNSHRYSWMEREMKPKYEICSWHEFCLNACYCSQTELCFALFVALRGLNAPHVICMQSLFGDFEDEEEFASDGSVAELDEDMLFGDLMEGEEIEEDEEIFNLNSGWSVNAFEGGGDSLGKGFDADELDDLDEDDEELGMAASELLRSVPSHVVKRLEVEQVEADKVNKEQKLRRAGGGGGTKPKTQRRLRIIGGSASGIRIHSQVRK